jgi:hypothetical protein
MEGGEPVDVVPNLFVGSMEYMRPVYVDIDTFLI